MFNNVLLDHRHAPFNDRYLERLENVIACALAEYPRTFSLRVDLHFSPEWAADDSVCCHPNTSSNVMARFTRSLIAKIEHYRRQRCQQGLRDYPNRLRYFWVRETETAMHSHYHAVLFFNKDLFRSLGAVTSGENSLWNMIQGAWLSALGLTDYPEYRSLVHFPESGSYILERDKPVFCQQYEDLVFRASYLAKERTKHYSADTRSMGASQG
ncbi:TPA: inovirus Gp2 family protein [Enterobacter hormaechei]|uniref:inovirus Gp2 family protein n=1 Tax=Enterobacter hormaechei TaxID=158836 RepID=UPI001866D17F|nr:inovirus Gp2 family protein [Enterobacter hormaechei]HCU0667154.1 inovirus Gp2 family protein [Enterobacter hormaechei]